MEAGRSLSDEWEVTADGAYNLEVYGPNGYFQKISGNINTEEPSVTLECHHKKARLTIIIHNNTKGPVEADIAP